MSAGDKMFVAAWVNGDAIHSYDLSTPFDISTAVFNETLSIGAGGGLGSGAVYDLDFNLDGSKLYVSRPEHVLEYDLSTP